MSRTPREMAGLYADEVWNAGRLDLIDELFAADHIYHDPLLPDLPVGPPGVHRHAESYREAMPDGIVTVLDWVEDGEVVVARWSYGGTQSGMFVGRDPTHRMVRLTGMHLFRVRGGKIVETWAAYDTLGLLRRLGMAALLEPSTS